MGAVASAPVDLSLIRSLGESDLTEDDQLWDTIFSTEIGYGSDDIIEKELESCYINHPRNFVIGLKHSVKCLQSLIKESESNPESKQFVIPIQTACYFLRLILRLIINHENPLGIFNSLGEDDEPFGEKMMKILIHLLHFRYATLRKDQNHWCSKPKDDSKCDWLRLIIVQSIILLRISGIEIKGLPNLFFAASTFNALRFYFHPRMMADIQFPQRRRKLIQCSLILMLLANASILDMQLSEEEVLSVFTPLFVSIDRKNAIQEIETFMLPLLLHLIIASSKYPTLVEKGGLQLILNILHMVDKYRQSPYSSISMFALAKILTNPIVFTLNVPCTAFESDWPVHRGTHADLLIEIVSRGGLLDKRSFKLTVQILSIVIPYSTNLSYVSAMSIFKVLSMSKLGPAQELIQAIHYSINRSVRENIPLVIMMLKNTRMLASVQKEDDSNQECKDLLNFAKTANQQLKQIGSSFSSSELEKFFTNPNIETLQKPVSDIPQTSFNYDYQYDDMLHYLAWTYANMSMNVSSRKRARSSSIESPIKPRPISKMEQFESNSNGEILQFTTESS